MKIALCLSGHLRKFEQTFPTIHNAIIKKYDCDVFIHTWDRLGYASNYKMDSTLYITDYKMPKVQEIFKPKKIIIESSGFIDELQKQGDEYAPHLRGVPKHVGHMAAMFYKIYACNELRRRYELETGTQYDWVIRCRPDLYFQEEINIPNEKINGRIYIPKAYSGHGWYTDQFAIGLPNDMDVYSSFFFNMKEYFSARHEYYPEKFMSWNFDKTQLRPEFYDVKFFILR